MDRPATPPIPNHGDERTMLNAFLDFYRAELIDRCFGLTDEQLRIRLSPSRLTLAGLVGHMAWVEGKWFRERLDGDPLLEQYLRLDWEADPDAEMTLAEAMPSTDVFSQFSDAISDSRRRVEATESLDQATIGSDRDGETWNLRWILIHMIEEYARHCGHADLIRESVDGDLAD